MQRQPQIGQSWYFHSISCGFVLSFSTFSNPKQFHKSWIVPKSIYTRFDVRNIYKKFLPKTLHLQIWFSFADWQLSINVNGIKYNVNISTDLVQIREQKNLKKSWNCLKNDRLFFRSKVLLITGFWWLCGSKCRGFFLFSMHLKSAYRAAKTANFGFSIGNWLHANASVSAPKPEVTLSAHHHHHFFTLLTSKRLQFTPQIQH